jgi:hypothetical protein
VIRSAGRGAHAMDETSLYHSEPPSSRAQSLAPIGASILRLGADLLKVHELDAKRLDLQAPHVSLHRDNGAPTILGV